MEWKYIPRQCFWAAYIIPLKLSNIALAITSKNRVKQHGFHNIEPPSIYSHVIFEIIITLAANWIRCVCLYALKLKATHSSPESWIIEWNCFQNKIVKTKAWTLFSAFRSFPFQTIILRFNGHITNYLHRNLLYVSINVTIDLLLRFFRGEMKFMREDVALVDWL